MKVLVACEESQRVTTAFRKLHHEAYSCDIQPCSGGHEEWHIHGDALVLLGRDVSFKTMDGTEHFIPRWDLIIAHPPCTYLTTTGNRWFDVLRYGEKAIKRKALQEEAVKFFMEFVNADCDKICVENPRGVMGTRYRSADQEIQPYWFGDPYEKRTCLWLKNLPPLSPDNVVEPQPRAYFSSGASLPAWYSDAARYPAEVRSRIRSKTFPGIARAMAEQWGKESEKENK